MIFDVDGNPVFIPSQRRVRRARAAPLVASGKVVKGPFGWMVTYPDGTMHKAIVQRAKAKGVKAIQDPRTGETLHVVRPTRRRRRLRKILGKYVLNPYILGAMTGFGLPKILSAASTVWVGTGIATAGYFSPSGSYMRKFAYGAGVGAGIRGALTHKDVLGTALSLAGDIGGTLGAIPSGIMRITRGIKPVTDVIDILTPGTAAHMRTGNLRLEAQRKMMKRYGGSIWRRITFNPVSE